MRNLGYLIGSFFGVIAGGLLVDSVLLQLALGASILLAGFMLVNLVKVRQ